MITLVLQMMREEKDHQSVGIGEQSDNEHGAIFDVGNL